jgi:Putative restriction endonuclease
MAAYAVRTRRWTRAEFDRLIDIGVFSPDERLELLGGELIMSEPQNSAHYTAIGLVDDALRAALPRGWLVRTQGPIELDDESQPEPDIAVTPGERRSYSRRHPSRPALVVEVAESRLAFDPRAQGEPLRACTLGGHLDRQPRRSRPGGLPTAGARSVVSLRLALRLERSLQGRIIRRAPGRSGSPGSRQRPPSLEKRSRP